MENRSDPLVVQCMRKLIVASIMIVSLITMTACSGKTATHNQEQGMDESASFPLVSQTLEETDIPDEYWVEGENYFDYQSGMECAAFASAYLLRHYGVEADGRKLFETFPSKAPDGGTMPQGIETLFQERGYDALFVTDGTIEDLKEELTKGAPVIVFIHVEEPYTSTHNTHYVPLVGYDKEYFYFAESLMDYANCKDETDTLYNRKTYISKFERLWENIDGYWDYPYYVISPKV